jgi:hypothetical protein
VNVANHHVSVRIEFRRWSTSDAAPPTAMLDGILKFHETHLEYLYAHILRDIQTDENVYQTAPVPCHAHVWSARRRC